MRCIAIDDEPLALKIISRYCEQIPSLELLGAFTDPFEGLSYIRSLQPDLLFLDVRMPDISGLNIVKSLNNNVLVIFTTAHRQYAVEGFELNVIDYLLKPFDFKRFMTAYEKAEERYRPLNSKITTTASSVVDKEAILSFRCNYKNVQLPFDHILYIEGFDNYVKIVTPDKTFLPAITLKNILSTLPETDFVRVHKSFVVSVAKIKWFNRKVVVIDKNQIPVGRTYLKEFRKKMSWAKTTK